MKTEPLKSLVIFLFVVFLISFVISLLIQNNNSNNDKKKEEINIIKKAIAENPEITAESALVRFVSKDEGLEKDLFEKNYKEPHLIASITKLMTATIAEENLDKNKTITIDSEVATDRGSSLLFKANEKWDYNSLLNLMLISSNNDAAESLATSFGYTKFVDLMNTKATEIAMINTHYINPSGLEEGVSNISTADDLAKLIIYIKNNHPNILEITLKDEYTATDNLKTKTIIATSTDLLLKSSSFPFRILGGKTGETPKAKKNLILLTEAPNGKGYIVLIVLKSEDNFADMTKLAHWTYNSFEWR